MKETMVWFEGSGGVHLRAASIAAASVSDGVGRSASPLEKHFHKEICLASRLASDGVEEEFESLYTPPPPYSTGILTSDQSKDPIVQWAKPPWLAGVHFLQDLLSFSNICSTLILRTTNGFLAVIRSILVYEIITHLRPSLDAKKATLCAVILSLYTLHWFFTFIYCTDVASLTAVLATYLLVLKKKYLFQFIVEDHEMLRDVSKRKLTPEISKNEVVQAPQAE
ncbi:unnamed protein product [Fraxinus pennsylvanica]|uniref:Dol-P-Glc:Glc(2)Man(9)GlcNAc(2)-PP-Dol alpha-1,2-glucosyltransferase n=1 Tax=Fraxinus pennsylvanica TaxID=56036 RepID=A0AAD2DQR5_9LAMI|nr:unnamed protein product [Fraxinus pennsylvanica]